MAEAVIFIFPNARPVGCRSVTLLAYSLSFCTNWQHTHIHIHTHTHTNTHTQTDRQTTHTAHTHTYTYAHKHTHTQTDKQTDRQHTQHTHTHTYHHNHHHTVQVARHTHVSVHISKWASQYLTYTHSGHHLQHALVVFLSMPTGPLTDVHKHMGGLYILKLHWYLSNLHCVVVVCCFGSCMWRSCSCSYGQW